MRNEHLQKDRFDADTCSNPAFCICHSVDVSQEDKSVSWACFDPARLPVRIATASSDIPFSPAFLHRPIKIYPSRPAEASITIAQKPILLSPVKENGLTAEFLCNLGPHVLLLFRSCRRHAMQLSGESFFPCSSSSFVNRP